ncbi:MAG: glycosyltransferase family 4 protein, partial [Pygmaiobacter sp.]
MGKKRILVVSQHYWPENFRSTDVCHGLTERGYEVDVLCGLPNYPKGEWATGYRFTGPRSETHEGIDLFRCGEIRRRGNTGLRIFLNYVSFPFFATFDLLRLRHRSYDAVFCYETSPVLMAWPAIVYAKLHKIPLTTYVLDLWPENLYSVLPIKNKLLRKLAYTVSTWHYKRSDRLIAMSPSLRDTLLVRTGKKPSDIAVIPQYCEELYTKDVVDEELQRRFSDKFNVVFAGNFSPAQGLENLVEVASRLHAQLITGIRFILVGDGMSRASLTELIRKKNVADYFVFEGQHPPEDIPKYHTLADVLVACLTRSEALGLTIPAKITSYTAAGRAVLCQMDGEGARVIREAGCGFACDA